MALALTAGLSVGLWVALQKSPPGPRPAYPPQPTVTSAFEDLPQGWTELPTPPEVRTDAATVWTGDRLIVWGGFVYKGGGTDVILDDGFVFDARTSRWTSLPASPLSPRSDPGVAWSGREMLVWGGKGGERRFNAIPQDDLLGDGGAYDPVRRTWRMLPKAPLSARAPHSVWTGREFIVWGTTFRMTTPHRDGAAYDPATDSWRTIADAPIELTDSTAVWTGQEMIVFGASLDQNNSADTENAIGAAYDPESDMWRRLPDSGLSPQASAAAWWGREMVAWDYEGESAAYDPAENRWRRLSRVFDFLECYPQSVASGGHVFAEFCGPMSVLEPGTDSWRDISRAEFRGGMWGIELVPADPAVLVLGSKIETDEVRMLAYRPSQPSRASTPDRNDTLDPSSALLKLPQCAGTGDRKEQRFDVPLPAAVDEKMHSRTSPPTPVTDVEIVNTTVDEALQIFSWLNVPTYIPDWPECQITEINHDGNGSGTVTITLHNTSDGRTSSRALDLVISDSLPLRLPEPRRDWARLPGDFFWDRRAADSIPEGLPRGTRLVWMSETKHYYELMGAVDLIEALRIAVSARRGLPPPEQSEEVSRICAQLRGACAVRSDFSSP